MPGFGEDSMSPGHLHAGESSPIDTNISTLAAPFIVIPNAPAALTGDHNSDRSVVGVRDIRPSRRLVLVSQPHDAERANDHEWDADTDSVPGASDAEVGDVVEPTVVEIAVLIEPRVRAVGGAFASLDVVNISEVCDRRPKLMQTVPVVFRSAMKLALQEILDGTEAESLVRATRGWKLFFLLPRMLLFRPARGDGSSHSTTVTGFSCSTRVQFRRKSLTHSQSAAGDVPRITTMRPRELPVPCHWCKLVNCLRPDKHWKELPWHHAHQPRWELSRSRAETTSF